VAIILPPQQWTRQPQISVGINPKYASRTKLALLPALGWQNLARGGFIRANTALPLSATQSGRTFEFDGSTTYAEYGPLLDAAAGDITCIAVIRANSGQYLGADGDRYLISSRTAGNAGFGWGIQGAIGGGAGGNVTLQYCVLNGIAVYAEANNTIESLVDTPIVFRYVKSTGLMSWFRFGVKSSADTSASTTPTTGGNVVVGQLGPYAGSSIFKHRAHIIVGMQGYMSDAEIYDLTKDVKSVWQLFAPLPRRIFVGPSAGGGSVTGTVAYTNANDTSSAAGTTTVLGTLAKTNANDTSAANGTTTVLGTLAKTNANDTSAASGTVGSGGSTGTVAYTNSNDTVVASGKTTIIGVLAKTNANDALVAAGWAGRITGTISVTNANDTVAASGISGTATVTAPTTSTQGIDWGALVRKTWGKELNAPEWDYEFSNGRRFKEKKNPYS
jgi:hypothetical protein